MNVYYLKPDEVRVECELRGIPCDTSDAVESLQNKILAEEAGSSAKPPKMHTNAGKRPAVEIGACRTKLNELKEEISLLKELDATQQLDSAQKIESRLMHVLGRLERARTSDTYGLEAQNTLESGQMVLSSLQMYLKDLDKLNESVDAVGHIDIPREPPGLPSASETNQAYAMSIMMAQIRELTQQVSELSKQCKDIESKPARIQPPPQR